MGSIYIHYGHSHLDRDLISRSSPCGVLAKPDKGLWASRIDAEWGWKDWCDSEGWYGDCDMSKHFCFKLKNNANILEIHKEWDILPWVIKDPSGFRLNFGGCETSLSDSIDREKLYKQFDGMELFLSDDYRMHDGIFNAWDCDSICVWNPDVIEIVEED